MPSAWTPSSLVTRIRGIREPSYRSPFHVRSDRRNREREGGYRRQSCTQAECCSGAESFVHESKDDARDQRADSEGGVVEPERGTLTTSWREIRDQGLLRPLGKREVGPIQQEPRDESDSA